jgi:hypothetical protein
MRNIMMAIVLGLLAMTVDHGPANAAAVETDACSPNSLAGCLATSTFSIAKHGIINITSEVDSLAVFNKGTVPVQSVSGQVTLFKGSTMLGTVPFSTIGIIPVNGTVTFSKAQGTLTSTGVGDVADRASFTYTSARGV